MKKLLLAIVTILISVSVYAQDSLSQEDQKLFDQAIEYCDNGEPEKAIDIYDKLLKKYPDEWVLSYEKAYCYVYVLSDNKKGLEAISKIKDKENSSPIVYSLEGACYDGLGQTEDAIKTFDEGLAIFPENAKLHFDKGITYAGAEMLEEAADEFYASIELDPTYKSSYFYLALILGEASSEIGEAIKMAQTHILLDPGSERSHDLSGFIYQLYNTAITLEDGSVKVSFTGHSALEDIDGVMEVPVEYRFQKYHEWEENETILKEKGSFSIADLTLLRKHFIETCFADGKNQDMLDPVSTLELQAYIAGHWEAYNMWMFRYGNPDEYNAWLDDNEEKFDAFAEWFNSGAYMDEDDS